MKKYVWLNLNTGEFSNSWDEEAHNKYNTGKRVLELQKEHPETYAGWKMIEYTCLNDQDFEFFNKMKLR